MTCSRPRLRCSRRCVRPWPPVSSWARSARWSRVPDPPACSWRRARSGRWISRYPCPGRACAGRWPGSPGRFPARPSSPRRSEPGPVNLISLEKAAKAYAHRTLLDGVSLGVSAGDRIGVVGRNGAGKSTLLALLAGRVQPDTGRVAMTTGLRLGYLPQSDQLAGTVAEVAFGGLTGERAWERDARVRTVVAELLSEISLESDIALLSGGERRRVA